MKNKRINLLAESNQGKYQRIFLVLRIKYNVYPLIVRILIKYRLGSEGV